MLGIVLCFSLQSSLGVKWKRRGWALHPNPTVCRAQAETSWPQAKPLLGSPLAGVAAGTWEKSHSLEGSIRGCPSLCTNCGGHESTLFQQQAPCLPKHSFCILASPEVLALYLTATRSEVLCTTDLASRNCIKIPPVLAIYIHLFHKYSLSFY